MSTSIPRYWVGRPGERDLDLRVSPELSESRDVRSGDLDLALRISRESTSAGGARPCLKSTNPKPNVTTWRGIISTSPTGNLIGRSGERDLDLLISPDLSGSRDVRSRDLDLALRISKESKSMSGAPPCFTPDEPKRKIAPWVGIMATSATMGRVCGREGEISISGSHLAPPTSRCRAQGS